MICDDASAREWLLTLPECDDVAMSRLDRLIAMLATENDRQNLVAKATLDQVWQRHVVDSAQLVTHVPRETSRANWLDLGTGAGFPGLVIAIVRPDISVTMVESRSRRIEWLDTVVKALDLQNAHVIGLQLEAVPTFSVDVISARAFAPLPDLLKLSARFSTPDTLWLLPKGRSAAQELDQLKGWDHMFHVEQSITSDDAGIVVGSLLGRRKKGNQP
ncbi:16S rRNA (guanine527-N7)-methyltransferase [Novosphingobium fluoreni]|uniref:Ribosomal RNA small subunit methyltransferase G n=1 Tax=Novosphingobium fluoreni TaxID=1391222 RepID=A0A7W6FWX3_9SPHN|nr:16S rRNA (guanine(527)-N(7))-methyltransferase RsmG [Novosphingobium fluoreni]MBB3938774.1 16S rRNA (guanine527-N7)-methyltransferase [Novosphingobium fluoreni]